MGFCCDSACSCRLRFCMAAWASAPPLIVGGADVLEQVQECRKAAAARAYRQLTLLQGDRLEALGGLPCPQRAVHCHVELIGLIYRSAAHLLAPAAVV